MKIKKGDTVKIMTGKDKGKTGRIIKVLTSKDRVVVEGLNLINKHERPTQDNPQGGIVQKEASIHHSNVMLFEKNKNFICIPFYPDKNDTLIRITKSFLNERNISISQANINLIVNIYILMSIYQNNQIEINKQKDKFTLVIKKTEKNHEIQHFWNKTSDIIEIENSSNGNKKFTFKAHSIETLSSFFCASRNCIEDPPSKIYASDGSCKTPLIKTINTASISINFESLSFTSNWKLTNSAL